MSPLWSLVRAEWTKTRTVASTTWLLMAAAVLTIGVGMAVSAVVRYQVGTDQDPVTLSLAGLQLGQALVAMYAVLAITGDYVSGMIHTTLIAGPRRLCVLSAKALVTTVLVAAAGTAAVLGSLTGGRALQPHNGFTPQHGFALITLTNHAAVGSIGHLCLIALLGTGIALAVRDSAAAIGIVLALLYLFPIAAGLVTDPRWQRRIDHVGPTTAGLGVLVVWATGLFLIGAALLLTRDA